MERDAGPGPGGGDASVRARAPNRPGRAAGARAPVQSPGRGASPKRRPGAGGSIPGDPLPGLGGARPGAGRGPGRSLGAAQSSALCCSATPRTGGQARASAAAFEAQQGAGSEAQDLAGIPIANGHLERPEGTDQGQGLTRFHLSVGPAHRQGSAL